MLNKKREKSKNNQRQENQNNEENKKSKKNKENNSIKNDLNKNKEYTFSKNINYTLDGHGKLKLIEGNLHILGYSLSENETIEFNFNEDYPLFKYKNSTNSSSKFEIFKESKYNIYTDIQQLIHASSIPKSLISLNYNNYSKYLICGKKCVGKSMLTPYIINRLLSNKQNKVYYLECDIIHPLIPLNFAISLIEIKKPIISNLPMLFQENVSEPFYNIIKSLFIRNSYDIKNIINVLDLLINKVYSEISNDKSILLVNQFSTWDDNSDVLNNYLFKTYFKSDEKSAVLYVKNNYKNFESSTNTNKDSILEDVIFKNKDDFYLFGNLFENKKETKCKRIEVETKYEGDDSTNTNCDLDINTKKKNEEKISILSHFELPKCKRCSLSLKNIIIFFDNPFLNELKINCKTEEDYKNIDDILIDSLLNKYCVIIRNNLDEKKNINDKYIENYFLDDIPFDKKEIISYTKIISYNKKDNILYFYSSIDIDDEIKKNNKIILFLDQRIEKVIKKPKADSFFCSLAKGKFSYDITKEDETLFLSNGLDYLSKIEENYI